MRQLSAPVSMNQPLPSVRSERSLGEWSRGLLGFAVGLLMQACGGDAPRTPSVPADPPTVPGIACGTERWSVKTLSDSDAASVVPSQVASTTVSALNAAEAHCDGAPDRRVFAPEFQVFEIVGRVTLAYQEGDRDYHIVVADLTTPSATMVVEVADPACAGAITSPHLSLLTSTRRTFDTMIAGQPSSLVGQTVRIRGVGFFDTNHNQPGRSRNCIELHPVLGIERVTSPPPS